MGLVNFNDGGVGGIARGFIGTKGHHKNYVLMTGSKAGESLAMLGGML